MSQLQNIVSNAAVLGGGGGGGSSPLTTKGDLYTYTTADARLPVGTNGQVLSADSAESTGLKWITAGGTGTVTSVSVVTANGVSGSVATATTTPAITLTLGAITPTSVAASGTVTGSNLSGTNTGDVTLAAVGAVPNANAASLSGQVLNLQPADGSNPGVVTTGTQTFAGAKTLSSAPTFSSFSSNGGPLFTNASGVVAQATAGTSVQVLHGGTTPSFSAVSLTADVSGTLPVASGGTNSTAALNNNRIMRSSAGAIVEAAAITASRALVSDANGIPVAATTTTTEINFVNGVTSAIQTQIDGKQPLDATLTGLAALTIAANQVPVGSGTDTFTTAVFSNTTSQAYAGSISWTGTTAPSGSTDHTYAWTQVGKLVFVRLNLSYSVAGSALSVVTLSFPGDLPTPVSVSSFTGASTFFGYGSGGFAVGNSAAVANNSKVIVGKDGSSNFQFAISGVSNNSAVAYVDVVYIAS